MGNPILSQYKKEFSGLSGKNLRGTPKKSY